MQKWKYFLKILLFIILISVIIGAIFRKIEQSSTAFYQASLPFKLKNDSPSKEFIDHTRYLLLYENNTVEQLSKKFKLSPDIIAGNLKILMKDDQVHFAVMFKSKDKKITQKIVQQAGKVIQKKQPETKQDGVLKLQYVAKQNTKTMLIGLMVGFFWGTGIISLLFKKDCLQTLNNVFN
ncbi:MAG: hypothetical protein LBF32_03325 [Streptococcaceae bacterium]|jgi:hypothetical protein|nr:hypothetical protein [Streptococcaceae bacterium]